MKDSEREGWSPRLFWALLIATTLWKVWAAWQLDACDDECQPEETRCEGNTALTCHVANSDMHKVGNPYIWHRMACPRLCVVFNRDGRSPVARCTFSAQPEPRCPAGPHTSFCDGNRLVDCVQGYVIGEKVCEKTCVPHPAGQDGYCQ